MYSAAAIRLRRCVATRRDGTPCRAWACWDDPQQRCVFHARNRAARPTMTARNGLRRHQHARHPLCRCGGYARPHRPGGGSRCTWPNVPVATSPAVTARTPVQPVRGPTEPRAERRDDPLRHVDLGRLLGLR
jgi:hypothetical protein